MTAITLYDYQAEDRAKVAEAFLKRRVTRGLGVWPTGCHAAGQGILMADGTVKLVEDIREGDAVMGPDSRPRRVWSLQRGFQDMVQITPHKGEPWTVNIDHVLTLIRTNEGGRKAHLADRIVDVTVREYLGWSKNQKHLYKLFRPDGVDFAPSGDMPLCPYFLGILLGDGSIKRQPLISTLDQAIFVECLKQAANLGLNYRVDGRTVLQIHFSQNWSRNNRLAQALKDLGLRGTESESKFIPHSYKTATRTERAKLLAGLLDTDGHLSKNTGSTFDYISKSQQLAFDVAFVARSLGLAAYVSPCYKKAQTGAVGIYHRVSISGDCDIIPTRLARKLALVRRQKKSVLRTGFTVVPVKANHYFGFTLDGDGRYLLDDFTVTHNSGKTVLFSELHLEPSIQQWIQTYPPDQRKILVIAHRDELIKQAAQKIHRSNPDLHISIDKAEKRAKLTADVIVASVQTMTASKGKRLHRLNPSNFRIVVFDEAHHSPSPSYQVIAQWFGFLPPSTFLAEQRPERSEGRQKLLEWQRQRLDAWDNQHRPDRLLLGVTATAQRGDNVGLECVFQEIVFNRSIREMIERGRLSRIRAFRVSTKTSLDSVAIRAGDFAQEKLGQAVNQAQRNAMAVRAYLDHCEDRKGITFCVNVAHALSMAAAYQAAGVKAEAIHGNLSDAERARILLGFETGEIRMLTNCQILTEGFDSPDVQCIIHARPTKSSLLYIQMTGRGLRIHEDKDDCIIIDIVDITKKHSLMTSPELLGLPAGFDAKGGDLLEAKRAIEELAQANPLADFTDVKSIEDCQIRVSEVDLLAAFHDETIDKVAALAWRKTGVGYEIEWKGKLQNERMEIERSGDGTWVSSYKKGQRPIWRDVRGSAEAAIKSAEAFFLTNLKEVAYIFKKALPWRQKPATESQRVAINSIPGMRCPDALTAGDANNILNAFFADRRNKRR